MSDNSTLKRYWQIISAHSDMDQKPSTSEKALCYSPKPKIQKESQKIYPINNNKTAKNASES